VRARLVALTGFGLALDKARAKQAGFDVHLTKPAASEEVLALVEESNRFGREPRAVDQ
jgi:CheY-like chemotaxis protein